MMRLCETAASKGKTVYFLGGSPGAASCAAGRLSQELPRLAIVGVDCPPKGFLDNPESVYELPVASNRHVPISSLLGSARRSRSIGLSGIHICQPK